MDKLMRAGIRRYLRSPIWWISVAAALGFGVLFGEYIPRNHMLEAFPFIYLHLIFACLISLAVGREVSERVVRNKIVAGHTKTKILFSELCLAVIACLILEVLFLTPFISRGGEMLAKLPLDVWMSALFGTLLFNIVCVVINVLISMLIHNRAVSAIACILLVLVMSIGAAEIDTALKQREFVRTPEFIYNEETGLREVIIKQGQENPNYVSGCKRKLYIFLNRCIPYGQAGIYVDTMNDYLQNDLPISEEQEAALQNNWCYSVGVTVVLAFAGAFLFRRRDIK